MPAIMKMTSKAQSIPRWGEDYKLEIEDQEKKKDKDNAMMRIKRWKRHKNGRKEKENYKVADQGKKKDEDNDEDRAKCVKQ